MDIDPARGDEQILGVDLAATPCGYRADVGNRAPVDGDITGEPWPARAVDDGAVPNDQIVHACPQTGVELTLLAIPSQGPCPPRRTVVPIRIYAWSISLLDPPHGAGLNERLFVTSSARIPHGRR